MLLRGEMSKEWLSAVKAAYDALGDDDRAEIDYSAERLTEIGHVGKMTALEILASLGALLNDRL